MQKLLLLISLLALSHALLPSYEIESLWDAWKAQHQKSYSALEETARFGIFSHNYKKILKFNEENDTPKLALNKFADLTSSEFKSLYASSGYYEPNASIVQENTQELEVGNLPAAVDWRNKGAVTPVKNQGQCGACWAFSATGVLEGLYFINHGELLSFSEQQIVDCDNTTDEGCNGGWPYLAIEYGSKNGLETEAEYPYTAVTGTCEYNKTLAHQISSGYTFVPANSTDQLKSALVKNPVSVLIEADQDIFHFYSTGVIKTGCGANLDLAALVVGYHKVGPIEAFIVKNAWGPDWGEDGYVQIWSNGAQNGGQGVCGILGQPVTAKK